MGKPLGQSVVIESGLKGFEVAIWHAVYAPKGTPKAAVDKLVAAMQEASKMPAFAPVCRSLARRFIRSSRSPLPRWRLI